VGKGFSWNLKLGSEVNSRGSFSAAGRRRSGENRNSFCERLTFGGGWRKKWKIVFFGGNEKSENHQK
jgi:hypothetical protein